MTNFNNYDYVIVGCGLSGAVAARILAERGNKVIILEKRNHIGGNMYDYVDKNGILVQQYGPHTFHTIKKELYDYMRQYEEWEEYKLMVMAEINGVQTPSPFNFKTIDQFYDEDEATKIKEALLEEYPNQKKTTIVTMLESKNEYIKKFADFLYDNDYKLYTAKQWRVDPERIDKSILRRVPIVLGYEEGYFDDEYQVMPKHSFTKFFENLLNHENIDYQLNCNALDYLEIIDDRIIIKNIDKVINVVYTGPIDELFNFKYGKLPYRSLEFEWEYIDKPSYQEAAVVQYPQDEVYTRMTEYTKIPYQDRNDTVIAKEKSVDYDGDNEPYYPVLTDESLEMYRNYKEKANTIINLILVGRLADFRYYNMDQALESVLKKVYFKEEHGINK
ncbi:MAG: UDP-galactopyranose mutase [Erysipelotrichales bacterium]|nr:UDP-galactopyranose mutase [Erysipelotrichales bacterium]